MQSKQFTLNETDWKAQAKSAFIFVIPSLLALLTVLTPTVQAIVPEGEQQAILLAVLVWGLNQVTGLLRRFQAGK